MIKAVAGLLGLTVLVAALPAGAVGGSALELGEYLFPNEQIVSNCHYKLKMQTDGNLVLSDWRSHVWWASNTAGRGYYTAMQPDGNLVVYDRANNALWASGTPGRGHLAVLQSDRNFVIYNSSNAPVFATNTQDTSGIGTAISPCNYRAETMLVVDADQPGNDYTHFAMDGSSEPATYYVCGNHCAADSRCLAFTYVNAGIQAPQPVCWLKTFAQGFRSAGSMMSGAKLIVTHNEGNL